ncbi:MAG: PTS sugar transporter subunit IIA [Spirochaetaceae bacterium]|jgi:PTS system fructose-specific IIC component/PTS system nitrogen regulatory IIA component|nr:PTS sugar transporter subunit IIA [Spirochaetaceae bacterium]
MLLSEVFMPQFIKLNLESDEKPEVFEELVDHFCQAAKLNVRDPVLAALKEREAKMSTGIRNGIAIPHGKCDAVDKMYGVLGVSTKGIEYDSLDGDPVHLVLMIIAPPVEAERHLHLLQRMASVLRSPDFYTEVIAASSPEAVFNIIKKYEDDSSFEEL